MTVSEQSSTSANDTIIGADTVIFSGNFADYTITLRTDRPIVGPPLPPPPPPNWYWLNVVDNVVGRDGVDHIESAKFFKFADVTLSVQDVFATYGTSGPDYLVSIGGPRALYGGDGDDTLVGSAYDDRIDGGNGNDVLDGQRDGNDTLLGGDGNDVLKGNNGSDTLDGGAGVDRVDYSWSQAAVQVDLTAGTTYRWGSSYDIKYSHYVSDLQVDVLSGIENVVGSRLEDSIAGDAGANSLAGGAGNDTLSGGAGDDTLDGGTENDCAVYEGPRSNYLVSFDSASQIFTFADTVGGAGSDLVTNVESFRFTDGMYSAKEVLDSNNGNVIKGGPGDDVLESGPLNDTIDGQAGVDAVGYASASAGVEVHFSTAVAPGWSTGGAGHDTLIAIESATGSAFADKIFGGDTAGVIAGGAGNDQLTAGAARTTLVGGAGDDALHGGGTGVARYSGNFASYDFSVTFLPDADPQAATVTVWDRQPRDGTDQVDGVATFEFEDQTKSLSDIAFSQGLQLGTSGNDTIEAVDYKRIFGGSGVDTVSYATRTQGVGADLSSSYTFSQVENLLGSQFTDSLTGTSGANFLSGSGGQDTIRGGAGDDTLDGGSGDDRLFGGAGFDTAQYSMARAAYEVFVDAGTSTFFIRPLGSIHDFDIVQEVESFSFADGTRTAAQLLADATPAIGAVSNQLSGTGANDVLVGSSGNDTLVGGDGDDLILGNGGLNTADYSTATGAVWIEMHWNATLAFPNSGMPGSEILIGEAHGAAGNDTLGSITTIVGSAWNDTILCLTGLAGAVDIVGGAGDDWLSGGNMRGGPGNDTLVGTSGLSVAQFAGSISEYTVTCTIVDAANPSSAQFTVTDSIAGRDGSDLLEGPILVQFAGSPSKYTPSTLTNVLLGTAGDDVLTNFNFASGTRIYGGAGSDTIQLHVSFGPARSDSVDGGDGSDTVSYANAASAENIYLHLGVAEGGGGSDKLVSIENAIGTAYGESITGNGGANRLDGMGGNDVLFGYGGDDSLYGSDGDDGLYGGAGDDFLDGGSGRDQVLFDDATHGIVANLALHSATGEGNDTIVNFEDLFGSPFDDTLTGDDGDNVINGRGGNNVIYGGAGNDMLTGGDGSNYVSGGDGDDVFNVFEGNDTFVGGAGNDNVNVNYGYVWPGFNTFVFSGNFADYAISFHGDSSRLIFVDSVTGRDGTDRMDGINAFQFADGARTMAELFPTHGGAGADSLTGTSRPEALYGEDGNDTLAGLGGDDLLNGGAGEDVLNGGSGANTLDGGQGFDTADYETADGPVVVNLATGRATASGLNDALSNIESVVAGNFDDSLVGNGGDNDLYGSGGNDTIVGGAGNDFLDGGLGADTLIGGAGDDTFVHGSVVVFSGNFADYSIVSYTGNSWFAVTDKVNNRDGADRVIGGAVLRFADGDHSLAELFGVVPTEGNDLMTGGNSPDLLYGLEGNDTMRGLVGDDTLYGNEGNDSIEGGNGLDLLFGEEGDDFLFGGADQDYLCGGEGSNTLDGGDGFDAAGYIIATSAIVASLVLNRVTGAGIQDTLKNMEGLGGSNFDDVLIGNDVANEISDFDGNDTVQAGGGDDTIYGGAGNDSIDAGEGTDFIYDGAGDDTIIAGGGTDFVNGNYGSGTDTLVFRGKFADYGISYIGASTSIQVVDGVANRDGMDLVVDIERFQFADGTRTLAQLGLQITTAGDDSIIGSFAADNIDGGAGNDTLDGRGGNDYFEGGDGIDTVTFAWSQAAVNVDLTTRFATIGKSQSLLNDVENLIGTSKGDLLRGDAGANVLSGGAGNDTIDGGAGMDTVSFAGESSAVKLLLAATSSTATGLSSGKDTITNIENIIGGNAGDTLGGNKGANYIDGANGNDTLSGGGGQDTLVGGQGDDTFVVDSAAVVVETAGQGVDTVQTGVTYTLGTYVENLVLTGNAALTGTGNDLDNKITGNSGSNILSGLDGNDTLDGGQGVDSMTGGAGDDTYFVDNAHDAVVESTNQGFDVVHTIATWTMQDNIEVVILDGKSNIGATGNAGDNVIYGNAAGNALNGAGGNDTLDGGLGSDALTGGTGFDVFRFSSAISKSNIDKITDFDAAADAIALDNTVFKALAEGALSAAAFQSGRSSVAASADVHIIFNTSSGALLYDADGAGGAAAIQFATVTLVGAGALTAADFVVV